MPIKFDSRGDMYFEDDKKIISPFPEQVIKDKQAVEARTEGRRLGMKPLLRVISKLFSGDKNA